MNPTQPRVLIAVATYNERDNLEPLVQEIRATAPAADLLIVDDNSPDGTGAVADALAQQDPQVRVIHRAGKLGLGTAVLAMMDYAMEHDCEFLVNLDADFSQPPRYLPDLLQGMDRADVMIGSRYTAGGGIENWPLFRHVMSRMVGYLSRILFGMPVCDTSGSYRCYRVAVLRRVRLDNLLSRGYSFFQEVLYRCHLAGARIGETPIIFTDRRLGRSKANLYEIARTFVTLLRLGWRAWFNNASLLPAPIESAAPSKRHAA